MLIDRLIDQIDQKNNPSVIGLDTALSYLPEEMVANCQTNADFADAIIDFNSALIDRLSLIVPAFKVQIAYYEMLGLEGLRAFAKTLSLVRQSGCIAIADAKRNDIGATAACYSKAFLQDGDFSSDMLTVNGYLGSDGLVPFVEDCSLHDRGIFVLVKTSNKSSAELQNLQADQRSIFLHMGELVTRLGQGLIGKYGYSSVGAVVGATHPSEAAMLRSAFPSLFFLVPGFGAQGGTASDLACCFDKQGRGALVNNSRGILTAYRQTEFQGLDFADAAFQAAVKMRDAINLAVGR